MNTLYDLIDLGAPALLACAAMYGLFILIREIINSLDKK